nr:PREDICTED: augurin [Struthio camelus australis]
MKTVVDTTCLICRHRDTENRDNGYLIQTEKWKWFAEESWEFGGITLGAEDGSRGNKLKLMLQKREAPVAIKPEVSVRENKAKEFLSSLKRQKRQLWDRTQPDVQQWYQQFLYLGFDEAKFEDDISYWTSLGRQGNEYYGGYYQHHYDEDSPIGPRNPHTFRHGAGVNYDDY